MYVWRDTQADSEGGSHQGPTHPRSLNHFYGAFLPGFLWPIIMLPGSESIFGIS